MASLAGFAEKRYQQHDKFISEIVKDFNKNKTIYAGGSATQAEGIPDISEAFIKAWITQETGGNDNRSKAAWKVDPAQVNVPGDWSTYKATIGLTPPIKRNEGNIRGNLVASLKWLTRKGFGKSGQAASRRSNAVFDGWQVALERYNGRSVNTSNANSYRKNYAARIIERAKNPKQHIKISLPKP